MRTEKCKTCRNYVEHPKEQRTGMEWMNATGWCELPRLSTKRRRIDEDNWCDQYVENANEQLDKMIEQAPEIPDESFGTETSESFEHWKLSIREAIWDIKASLDALDTLANAPYEDKEPQPTEYEIKLAQLKKDFPNGI